MRNSSKAVLVVLGMSAFLSCGGDDGDGGSCSPFTPCGGDVVGTWSIENMCATGGAAMVEDCPGATTTFEGIKGSGTVTYKADMTTTSNVSLSGNMKMTLPSSCLMGLTCAQLDATLKTTLLGGDSDFSAVACSGSGSCSCTVTFKGTNEMSTGTYMVSGNKIIDSDGDEQEYCVTGSTMKVRTPMSMAGMMEDLAIQGTLKKQ